MSDLISRTVAVMTMQKICDRECEYSPEQRSTMCDACRLGSAIDAIGELPIYPDMSDDAMAVFEDIKLYFTAVSNVAMNVQYDRLKKLIGELKQ